MENISLGFTWFDIVALVVVALSGVMAFARGLIREVFSIIAFVGAAVAGVFFSSMFQPTVEQFTALDGGPARVAAGVAIFLVVFIAVTIAISALAKTAHQSTEIGSFDRAAGLAFGVLRGVLVVSLFVLLMRNTTDDARASPQASMPEAIVNARTYPVYESVAMVLERVLPRARQRARDMIEQRGESESAPIPPAETNAAPPAAPPAGETKN